MKLHSSCDSLWLLLLARICSRKRPSHTQIPSNRMNCVFLRWLDSLFQNRFRREPVSLTEVAQSLPWDRLRWTASKRVAVPSKRTPCWWWPMCTHSTPKIECCSRDHWKTDATTRSMLKLICYRHDIRKSSTELRSVGDWDRWAILLRCCENGVARPQTIWGPFSLHRP